MTGEMVDERDERDERDEMDEVAVAHAVMEHLEHFQEIQWAKLSENMHKSWYGDLPVADLWEMLRDEVVELEAEICFAGATPLSIARECADIANVAMFIAAAVTREFEPGWELRGDNPMEAPDA